jgi:two-component system nitrogen regulation sensor histidine kinase GlnL
MLQQDIIDNISSGIIGLDAGYRVRLINPAAEALLQLSEARLLGRPICELVSPDLPWRSTLDQAGSEGRAIVRRGLTLEMRDGHAPQADMVITPLRGVPDLEFLVELQPVDRLLRISREENLQNAQQTTRTVVRGLAHEIKNPLGGIRGAAQLLERELPEGPLRDYTRIIIREADRLRDLVDRLLGPRAQLKIERLNVHVSHGARAAAPAVPRPVSAPSWMRDYDPSLPDMTAIGAAYPGPAEHPAQRPAGDRDQRSLRITLRTRSQRQFTIGETRHRLVCRIDVIDNGPGIPEDLRETLFMPMVSGRRRGHGARPVDRPVHRAAPRRPAHLRQPPGDTCFSIFLPMDT